jgi:hypothetical protein
MSRNECFFQVQISHILRFISICDLFTDSPSYIHRFIHQFSFRHVNLSFGAVHKFSIVDAVTLNNIRTFFFKFVA